ncbi:MAG TPA: amino acid permease [Streptosporangiaceae bacterium]|nr:amino acid permease [Streptosporangiaceae bacterium]
MGRAAGSLVGRNDLAEGLGYAIKRRLLGKPLINEQLAEERLSNPLALGVLSCDGISSANYGSELILHELLPFFGLTAFTLLLPMTGVILAGIALVVLLYREVVSVYTRAGGSYVVARENFGPRIAQVAAVALMVDYVVTVAVQTAAGSQAILSTFPVLARPLGDTTTLLIIAVAATLIMCFVNLRGVRENGKTFALPTYLFAGAVGLMIIVGVAREAFGGGLTHVPWHSGTVPVTHHMSGVFTFEAIYILGRAFANGGSSLTGIEAVSNAVSALRPPEGHHARQILVTQGSIVAFLIAGISWLAHVTHAVPYISGVPTVLSQEAGLIFGHALFGHVLFYILQVGAAAILFTGGNTSFSGFPFLASFVAEDSFLPRWLSKRGHRLVFSNGIIVLTVLALALLLAVGANTNNLVPFYAIGVFTGFTMAGFGMARYWMRHKAPGWRQRLVISLIGGIYTALVVVVFALVKFTEGAWLVVVVFPIGVFAFIRLNRQYRLEATVLEGIESRRKKTGAPEPVTYARRTVFVFVDDFDLATIAALRYARSLRPTTLVAVHFVIDNVQADKLRQDWVRANTGIPLDFVDCPDRRIAACAAALVSAEATLPGVGVTAILPRRSYAPVVSRLLHDRTADKMAGVISRIPYAVATIVPFDVRSRVESLAARHADGARGAADTVAATVAGQAPGAGTGGAAAGAAPTGTRPAGGKSASTKPAPTKPVLMEPAGVSQTGEGAGSDAAKADSPIRESAQAEAAEAAGEPDLRASDRMDYDRPVPPEGVNPIGTLTKPARAVVQGRVHAVEIRPVEHSTVLACDVADSTGELTALFYGRSNIPGLRPGSKVRLRGQVGIRDGMPIMINPAYELLAQGDPSAKPKKGRGPRKGPE